MKSKRVVKAQRVVGLREIRKAIADYMSSEGCDCCQDIDGHKKHKARLATLLNVPMYHDRSGYNFSKYKTKAN